ncbi:MAG: DUF2461 domain-containing protein [Mariniblastus sp.]
MFEGFTPDTLKFFKQLSKNNNRDWFAENKPWYEEAVLNPALELVKEIEKPLKKVSPHFTAIPKKSGGSLMRIYRDIRFSKNKTPYKTNLGVHFRHEVGKNVHAPGFYFHIDKDEIFIGAGIWRPDSPTIKKIRALIDDDAKRWKRVTRAKVFRDEFELSGDTLKRPPRGYDEYHPQIADLKRKDFVGVTTLDTKELYSPKLIDALVSRFKKAMPFVRFLCDSIPLPS